MLALIAWLGRVCQGVCLGMMRALGVWEVMDSAVGGRAPDMSAYRGERIAEREDYECSVRGRQFRGARGEGYMNKKIVT